MRILVTDGMDKTAMAELKAQGHEVVEQFYEPAELGKALRDFDVVVVRSKTKVRAAQIDEEVKSIVDAAYERCEDILSRDQKHLIAVAEFLLAHETMSAEEFEAVFTDEAAGHDKI